MAIPAFCCLLLTWLLAPAPALAVGVGDKVQDVVLRDADDAPATLPQLGRQVLVVFYNDPDVADQNDPFAALLWEARFPDELLEGVGVVNLKESDIAPARLIRAVVRYKADRFHSAILLDPDRVLARAWGLGDCADQSVVLVIDTSGTVRYLARGPMSPDEQRRALALVERLVVAGGR